MSKVCWRFGPHVVRHSDHPQRIVMFCLMPVSKVSLAIPLPQRGLLLESFMIDREIG